MGFGTCQLQNRRVAPGDSPPHRSVGAAQPPTLDSQLSTLNTLPQLPMPSKTSPADLASTSHQAVTRWPSQPGEGLTLSGLQKHGSDDTMQGG